MPWNGSPCIERTTTPCRKSSKPCRPSVQDPNPRYGAVSKCRERGAGYCSYWHECTTQPSLSRYDACNMKQVPIGSHGIAQRRTLNTCSPDLHKPRSTLGNFSAFDGTLQQPRYLLKLAPCLGGISRYHLVCASVTDPKLHLPDANIDRHTCKRTVRCSYSPWECRGQE
jgi:hypothetical protein